MKHFSLTTITATKSLSLIFSSFATLLPDSPAVKATRSQSSLQLVMAPFARLHVKVLEDVDLPFGADLGWGHLQRVVVQRYGLEVPQVPVAHGNMGNAVT